MKFEFYHGLPAQARKIREDVFVKEQGFWKSSTATIHAPSTSLLSTARKRLLPADFLDRKITIL